MLKKLGSCVLLACVAVIGQATPSYAQRTNPVFSTAGDAARHTFNFTIGLFSPTGIDGRADGDVLVVNQSFLVFDIEDFKSATFGFEYLIPIGNFVEAGAGLSFSKKTVPTVYAEFIDSDGSEIDQELSLRQIPLAFTVRVLPFGQDTSVQPYVGAGLGVTKWNYSEIGEFIGENDLIFDGEFEADGWSTGFLFLGGVRFATSSAVFGGEFRYQTGEGELPTDFFGSVIDLGGWTLQGTLGFRF